MKRTKLGCRVKCVKRVLIDTAALRDPLSHTYTDVIYLTTFHTEWPQSQTGNRAGYGVLAVVYLPNRYMSVHTDGMKILADILTSEPASHA